MTEGLNMVEHRSTALSTASHYFNSLIQDLPGKGLWMLLSSLWATIPQMYLFAIGWLVADLSTGLWKAYTIKPNESRRGQEGIIKVVIYLAMLSLAEYASRSWSAYAVAVAELPLIGEYISPVLLIITKGLPFIASFLITHTETTSCLENLQEVAKHHNRSVPALDMLIKILRVRGSEIIERFTGVPQEAKKEGESDA